MAGSSLLALIDDIATLLDDVAVLTKVAAKKTAGVLGDDLALNAEQVTGVRPDRELPVVWAVFKGSALNKLILVPAALLISTFAPGLITPLLMLGGLFLCFEGFEKVAHKLLHGADEDAADHDSLVKAVADEKVDIVQFEKDKIKGAVRTDFILSAEIIVISLGAVASAPLWPTQVVAMALIAALMTIGVYGIVAAIVKLDDLGLHLAQKQGEGAGTRLVTMFGRGILRAAPWLMKGLSVAGTAAMFLVGGGILAHGIPGVEPLVHDGLIGLGRIAGDWFHWIEPVLPMLLNALIGIVAGGLVVVVVTLFGKITGVRQPAH